ncbi:1_t:CDS:2 [Rhizophagus irregularis]|nr:1_t:CDS:2 [Rhizophagus irregularis]
MAKVATDFMKRHKWTFETPSSELAQYTEEISKSLKDDRKVRSNAKMRFRVLGLTKEQVEVLIPIRPTGKREEGRDTVDKIAQEIVEKDYPSEKIKQISYDLGSSTPNPVAGTLDETWRPKKTWYNPKYSWYCTGYSKVKEETGVGEPWPFVSIEKNLLQAKDLLTWIQKAIPEKFPFLRKNKSGIVNVNPINLALAQHGITSSKLRKIGADHASRIHGSRNNSHR